MVQRPPDPLSGKQVRKRDGRLVPFRKGKLGASLEAALEASGRRDPGQARDLAQVVMASLASEPGAEVEVTTIARRVEQVLAGAHCHRAARLYRLAREARPGPVGARVRPAAARDPVRAIPPAWEDPRPSTAGRVARMLEVEASLAPALAQEIAAEVDGGVLASGLPSVSPALLREWTDNALLLRGLPARLGQHQFVGLAGHELRAVLAAGHPGAAVEAELAGRLLTDYALREVFPAEVAQAHDAGLLGLEHLALAGRAEIVALAPWRLPVLAESRGRRARLRALGPVLRNLSRLCAGELLLIWDGPALSVPSATDLLVQAGEPSLAVRSAARTALFVPAASCEAAGTFLQALEDLGAGAAGPGTRVPVLRFEARAWSRELLSRAVRIEQLDARLQFAAAPPSPGMVASSVAINLARAALAAGRRRVGAFLDGVEDAAGQARQALAAREALMNPAPPPREALARVTGLPAGVPADAPARLALSGWRAACSVLLGDGPVAREKWEDLAAAVGERIQRCVADDDLPTSVGWAGTETRARFGRLDLATFPQARDRLPLTPERNAFRYDGFTVVEPGVDPAEAGREAARLRQRLGIDAAAPAPRSTGGVEERLAFLSAFLSAAAPRGIVTSCA